MDDSAFWKIIEVAKQDADGDCNTVVKLVHRQLKNLPAAEIQSFEALQDDKLRLTYSWPLWGAAYLINGGCSDDGFEYFRCWLIRAFFIRPWRESETRPLGSGGIQAGWHRGDDIVPPDSNANCSNQGKAVFDAALAQPDSLADIVDPENDNHEREALLYIARQTYKQVTGQEMAPGKKHYPPRPIGENWDFDDEVATAQRLPRLSRLYAR